MAKSVLEGRSQDESRELVFPAEGKARAWTWKQHSVVSHQPRAGACPSKYQGPFVTWGPSHSGEFQLEAKAWEGGGAGWSMTGGPREGSATPH